MRWATIAIARMFRGVFLVREARARAASRVAETFGLATAQEVRELDSRADLLLGRARRAASERRRGRAS
jgi:hypothetical protein